jgi:predicted amidophosphoribosyltransferase
MAAQIAANAPPGLLDAPATLVPVPLHPSRLRRRGFNQAERLAAALGRRTGLAVCDCLQRRGPATRQVGRDRDQRLTGAGMVVLRPGRPVPGHAVLVDDVATTGATLAACAQALRAAGARRLAGVAFARTPGR